MTIKEFEQLTGFYPSPRFYAVIDQAYMEYAGDKTAFCKAYKDNVDCLAGQIQLRATILEVEATNEAESRVNELKKQIADLTKKLEIEQEWKPYEDADNVAQADYEKLAGDSSTEVMDDEKAKALLYDWFGFAIDRIKIHHAVPVYEVNRHRQLRKAGELDRRPLYNATDWNYIRFECGLMSYELTDGELRMFMH